MAARQLRIGEIEVREVSRTFEVVHDRNLTLKETILKRRRKVVGEPYWALRDVDFSVPSGQSVGIVGRNGSGKSTLLKTISGILPPSSGSVESAGQVAAILELGAGFSPDFSGLENIYLNAALLGIRDAEVEAALDEIISFAELEDFIHAPVRTYSSGMQVRLAFSIASHVRADILILDEVFAVGDEAFQRKCLGRMFEFRRAGGTILFVSHDASAIERICDRVILLESGEVVADGPVARVIPQYHKLLSDRPSRTGRRVTPAREAEIGEDEAWGTGEVAITAVRLLDADGRATDSYRSGDGMVVEVDYRLVEEIDSLSFGIAVHSVDGAHVSGTNTVREGIPLDPCLEEGTVRFVVPALALNAGRFSVTVACGPTDERTSYHWLDRCREFDVYPRAPRVGLVAFDYDISLLERPAGRDDARLTSDGRSGR